MTERLQILQGDWIKRIRELPDESVQCCDPFAGTGTTGKVALEFDRKAILIELNPDYISLIEKRTDVTPGLPL
jgi:DNA modification methylase